MERAMTGDDPAPVPRTRWLVLAGYSLLVASTQLLWLAFAPVTAQAHQALGVSEGAIGDLAAINPLMYVLLALPAGRWLDRRFGRALTAGALLTAGGALLRMADPASYGWILAGQVVISAGQPLVVNSTTKVAARYFPAPERTAAISVASAAQFCGILAAALTGGPLEQAGGLRLLLGVQAVVAVIAAACVLVAVRVPAAFPADSPVAVSLGWLRRDRVMWLLAGLLFVGVGVFNAVATWLDSILTHFGEGGASGPLIALMTAAGIAGAAVLPGAVARRNRRRAMLLTASALTAGVFVAMAVVHNVVFIGCALALEGFVLLAGLPVSLDWSELRAGPQRAGTAAGFLLLAGNLGGTVFVLIIQALIGNPYLSLAAMSVIALPGLALAARLPARVTEPAEDDQGPHSPARRAAPAKAPKI
jgi:predicted MFS family arabinose efflux permease